MPEIAADGRARTARRDAERLHVRHHLPRHQHAADVRRPVLLARRSTRYAGIIINTGEDNYLTTADAFDEAHTVLASPVHQRAVRLSAPACAASRWASATPSRSTRQRRTGFLYETRPGADGARDLPRGAAQVHAADEAHRPATSSAATQQNALFNIVDAR
ncbi:MAG: lysine 5,6-aminomutase subunit alpha [Bacillus subtilis]|nr:lysine 5,6-aminomutase subunit alpha [Bacillus subtilis]